MNIELRKWKSKVLPKSICFLCLKKVALNPKSPKLPLLKYIVCISSHLHYVCICKITCLTHEKRTRIRHSKKTDPIFCLAVHTVRQLGYGFTNIGSQNQSCILIDYVASSNVYKVILQVSINSTRIHFKSNLVNFIFSFQQIDSRIYLKSCHKFI